MKGIIKAIFISVVLTALAGQFATAGDTEDHESLYAYLAGHYLVVGKELDGERTYHGRVEFSHEKGRLAVTRDIQGQIVSGEGRIELALGSDAAKVLRVRFARAGEEFEITYLWRSDLDNYARLTGYMYRPGKQTDSPGMEALFIDHGRMWRP